MVKPTDQEIAATERQLLLMVPRRRTDLLQRLATHRPRREAPGWPGRQREWGKNLGRMLHTVVSTGRNGQAGLAGYGLKAGFEQCQWVLRQRGCPCGLAPSSGVFRLGRQWPECCQSCENPMEEVVGSGLVHLYLEKKHTHRYFL